MHMLDQGKQTIGVRVLRGTLLFLMRIFFRIEHFGMENIPDEGPLILAANHVTYFDPPWISVRIYRTVRIMTWDRLFIPPAGWILRWLGAFPVSLSNPESSSYRSALNILQNGEALMIFPEGGRSPDGSLMPFKTGAARLALRTGAAIVPVAVQGGERVWSKEMFLPRPAKVQIHYLPPIRKEQFPSDAVGLTGQLREAIANKLQAASRGSAS